MKKSLNQLIGIVKRNPFIVLLIIIAAVLHLVIILPSGSHYCFNGICGDFFWGVNEHDAIWHIAVSESAFKIFPPRNPIFAGSTLSGYNSLLDFILFIFSLVGISPFLTYFKIMPIVWFIFFTYSAILLGKKIQKKKMFIFLFLFLSYFGASFSFIIPLIKAKTIMGTSSFLAMQAILTLTNVQLAFSYIVLFFILIMLFEKKLTTKKLLILCVFIFIQWGLKFYAGFISVAIIGMVFLIRWIKEKDMRYFAAILFLLLSSIISLFLNYNPFGQLKSGGAPFIFSPLALVWPLIEDPSMFYSQYWSNAKYALLASSKMSPRLIVLMGVLIFAYIILNLGPRIIGLIFLIKKSISKKRNDIDIGILFGVLLSLVFPIFFIQRGIWWNTVQFFFPIFLLLNIYIAEFVTKIKNKIVGVSLLLLIIVISIPYTIDAISSYMIYPGVINVSDNEKKALLFLKNLPDGVVYVPLYKPNSLLNKNDNAPLFNHVDSSYIPAYTGKQALYANFVQLALLNIDYEKRREQIKNGDCSIVSQVKYAYIPISQNTDLLFKRCIYNNTKFIKIYNSSSTLIYSKNNK